MDYQCIEALKTPDKIGIITLKRPEKRYMNRDAGLGFEESFINEHDIPFQAAIPKK